MTDGIAEFTVLSGNPTPAELAAVTAVLSALVDEADGQRMPVATPSRNAWSSSQRTPRRPIVPGVGAWNRQIL